TAHLDRTKEHDLLAGSKHVAQEWLIQPGDPQAAALILHKRFKDLEARAARGSKAAVHHLRNDGGGLTRLQRSNRRKTAAIFIADGKAIEKILDRREAGVCEVGSAARPDAFQKLQRRRERVGGHPQMRG